MVLAADAVPGLLDPSFPATRSGTPCAARHLRRDPRPRRSRGPGGPEQIVGRTGHAFGTLTAAVANIAQPERIILTGEGIRLAQVGESRLRAGIAQARHTEASPIDLRLLNDDPMLCARGASAVASQRTVLATRPLRTT